MALFVVAMGAPAQKILVYDEEKGIIFVEKESLQQQSQPRATVPPSPQLPAQIPAPPSSADDDIHQGRHKDPPQVYFKSGLEYFRNRDYPNALKNFLHAQSKQALPEYALWIGKTHRQLGDFGAMLNTMNRILKQHPASDVADDALFEIAFYYQTTDEYHKALTLYTQLSEQYPFGVSYSNGEQFREVAREQRQVMQAELVAALNLLGFEGEELEPLVSAYQQGRQLTVSGAPDRATVRAIKEDRKVVEDERSTVLSDERSGKQQKTVSLFVTALLVVVIIMQIVLFRKLRRRLALARTLEITLSKLSAQQQ
jgi:tetratricopeptide (TPR) repeat protein